MNTRETILDILLDVVPEIEPDSMAGDVNYREAFDIDSMDFMAILERVAEELGVDVPEDYYSEVQTLDGSAYAPFGYFTEADAVRSSVLDGLTVPVDVLMQD